MASEAANKTPSEQLKVVARKTWEEDVRKEILEFLKKWAPAASAKQHDVFPPGETTPKTLLEIISDPRRFSLFYQALTDSSFDGVNNYKLLEAIGDKVWGACVGDYCYRKIRNQNAALTPEKLSNIFSNFAAKDYQSKVSLELNFTNPAFLRVSPDFAAGKISIEELQRSIMEAVFGATFLVCNDIIDGLGFTVCAEMTGKIIKRDINLQENYRDPGSELAERFRLIGCAYRPDINTVIVPGRGERGGFVEMYLPACARQLLSTLPAEDGNGTEWSRVTRKNPTWLVDKLVSLSGLAGGEKKLRRHAYKQAVAVLNESGLDGEWFRKIGDRFYGIRRKPWYRGLQDDYNRTLVSLGLGSEKPTHFRLKKFEKKAEGYRYWIEHVTWRGDVLAEVGNLTDEEYLNTAYQLKAVENFIRQAAQAKSSQSPATFEVGGAPGKQPLSVRITRAGPRRTNKTPAGASNVQSSAPKAFPSSLD